MTRSPINLTWLKTVVLSTYIHVICVMCACLYELWNTDIPPPSPIFEAHTAERINTHCRAGRSFRYNTPTDRHDIIKRRHGHCTQHLRWRAAAPEWKRSADSGCMPPWLTRCAPEAGEKTHTHRRVNMPYVRNKALYLAGSSPLYQPDSHGRETSYQMCLQMNNFAAGAI